MFCIRAFTVNQSTLGFSDKLVEVRIHVSPVDLPDVRLAVIIREFIRGLGNLTPVSFTGRTSVGIGDGDKEIRSGLSIGWFVSHVDKVLAGERSWTVVDHSAIVDDTHFVEDVIHVLGGLVGSHDSCRSGDICANPKSLDELERG